MDTIGWSGALGVSFSIIDNTKQFLNITTKAHLQWRPNLNNKFLLVGQYGQTKGGNNIFQDYGFGHLRFTRRLNRRFALESFAQAQYNKINQLKFRGLLGIGPRYLIIDAKTFNLVLAVLLMQEREITKKEIFFEEPRVSAYISFTYQPSKLFRLINTTYYQPRIKLWRDYRISSEAKMEWTISKHLKFKSALFYGFDIDPPEGAKKQNYQLHNGLSFSF